jgi:Na+/H+-dicarboxylate symporter
MKKIPLYLQIFIALFLGLILGIGAVLLGFNDFVLDWIKPWGEIFMRLLKMIAVPLIAVSLVKGISNLEDISRLSSMGLKTISMYLVSTVLAITIGLVLVNIIQPGQYISEDIRQDLLGIYSEEAGTKKDIAISQKNKGPLDFVVEMVPENIIASSSENRNMLQLIFFTVLFGIAIIMLPKNRTEYLRRTIDDLNEVILKVIDFIMKFSPMGVFALLAGIIVDVAGDDIERTYQLFSALALYSLTVIIGLLLLIVVIYPLLIRLLTKRKVLDFIKAILPAQLLGFSTSSSAATLPVTMECAEENLKVKSEVSSFVLPIGATINMDGTSLYQAVAAVFIAEAFGYDLSLIQQLTIVLTATFASIGSAAVPGAGIVMLVIVLESIGIPSIGVALIFAPDRPLDMLRTATNLTGDLTIATIINKFQKKQ